MHINKVLTKAMRAYRREDDTELTKVWALWDQAVGKLIAENTRPAAFKGKLLIVHAADSTWIHHLQFLKKDIITSVNTAFGKELVENISFKIGSV